mgnify:CR=1 FL=1
MIVSTTPTLEGKKIISYKGIVFGEVVSGVDFVKDFALKEMEQRAHQLGANAVVGVDIDYEILGSANNMMMVIASGTAVVVE